MKNNFFYREEEASWTLVTSGSRPRSAAGSISGDQPRQSVFARLANFPTASSNVASDNNVHSLPILIPQERISPRLRRAGIWVVLISHFSVTRVASWAIFLRSAMTIAFLGFFPIFGLPLSPAHRLRPGTWTRSRTGLSQLAQLASLRSFPLLASFVWDLFLISSLVVLLPPQLLCSAPLFHLCAQTLLLVP